MIFKHKVFFATFGLVLVPIIWGFAFIVVKNSVNLVPPFYMLAFRFTLAVIPLSVVFIKKFKVLNIDTLKTGFILGVFLFIAYVLQTVGIKYTTAGKNAFLTTIYVIVVPYISFFLTKYRPNKYEGIAAFIAMLGIGLISLTGDFSINRGDMLTLACGIVFGLHIVLISRYAAYQDPVLLTIVQLGVVALFSWIFAPVLEGYFPAAILNFNSSIIISMGYLGFFSTMLAFLLQTICQKYTPPAIASLLLSLEAVFGILFSVLFLKEHLTVRMLTGCIILFFAIILAQTKLKFMQK